jgi:hypothetical protein
LKGMRCSPLHDRGTVSRVDARCRHSVSRCAVPAPPSAGAAPPRGTQPDATGRARRPARDPPRAPARKGWRGDAPTPRRPQPADTRCRCGRVRPSAR